MNGEFAMEYNDEAYDEMIEDLFARFPSFQKVGGTAYKPGIDNMIFFDQMLGHPHRGYATVHVAGTNGKGSVSNMLASILAASGLKTGLYTSPHILDFRERMRIVDGRSGASKAEFISKQAVWSFVEKWRSTFDHLDLSFFEITTMMAFEWFRECNVDVAVIETGLGGRLDSTNIISPVLSVITNIGLDHCDYLGFTLPEIAFEKAGIMKPCTYAVVGESSPETDAVFERKILYTNISEPSFAGDRKRIMSLLRYADRTSPRFVGRIPVILSRMDLQGKYQEKNLRTVMAAADILSDPSFVAEHPVFSDFAGMYGSEEIENALIHTAERTDFHGRWERAGENPAIIADIGHNAHGLVNNFGQLDLMREKGEFTHLIVVFGMVSDKDVESVFPLLPAGAEYFFTNASGKRALPAATLMKKYEAFCQEKGIRPVSATACGTVCEAVDKALERASDIMASDSTASPLIYVGGSTFVVAEFFKARRRS